MKDYIGKNKIAWEDAYLNRSEDFDKDMLNTLKNERLPFLNPMLKSVIERFDFKGKSVVQFCTNNGRELLSIAKEGIFEGVGFDIAKNMVDAANQHAIALKLPASFIEKNILEIDDRYNNQFDFALITIGAICWFEDLDAFFKVVAKTLKIGGLLIMNEGHPFYNMLATPYEDNFKKAYPMLQVNDYFKTSPWVEQSGMGYMTGDYQSKTFVSFSHTFSSILNSLIKNNIQLVEIKEYDIDIANLFGHLDQKGMPLSYHLIGSKT